MRHITKPPALLMVAALSAGFLGACKKDKAPPADMEFYRKVQAQLIQAKPGDVIELPEGTFHLDRSLSSTVDGVTIRGKGMDKTVLSFKGQT
ncbi:MAG: hypothetical protein L0Y66_05245, partial [Myxococcaceae bacterium]|nr:hypothetical protein [Myxococcaceae bacterium]